MTDYQTKSSADGSKDTFSTGYQRDNSTGKGAYDLLPFFALDRDAKLYERGAAKYGRDNWMKGAPFSRTMQSVIRHICQYMRGDRSEDHLAAARWGLASVMTYEELIARGHLPAELDDLPRLNDPKAPEVTQLVGTNLHWWYDDPTRQPYDAPWPGAANYHA